MKLLSATRSPRPYVLDGSVRHTNAPFGVVNSGFCLVLCKPLLLPRSIGGNLLLSNPHTLLVVEVGRVKVLRCERVGGRGMA
jgi:hypothetical protein